jgi:ribonucleoside-diphosphate reductase alpha chain
MGATHAEKSTTKTGHLNAVPSASAESSAEETKLCSIENPDCEACQ